MRGYKFRRGRQPGALDMAAGCQLTRERRCAHPGREDRGTQNRFRKYQKAVTPLLWAKPYFDSLRLKMRLEVLGHGDKSKGPLLTSPSLTQRHAKHSNVQKPARSP